MTRDELISEEISKAETQVEELASTLGGLVAHAEQNEATAHAALYEAWQAQLTAAAKDLGRAWSVMANGNPEDYVS